MSERQLEDRIEDAREQGVRASVGEETTGVNPYQKDTPEYHAWQTAYETHRPKFDSIAYATEMGLQHARDGSGFTPPFPLGTPERRAWQQAYSSIPKGVPTMRGSMGRSEDKMAADLKRAEYTVNTKTGEIGVTVNPTEATDLLGQVEEVIRLTQTPNITSKVWGSASTTGKKIPGHPDRDPAGDPYTKLLADAMVQGTHARDNDLAIGTCPYDTQEVQLKGPADAWRAGWRERDAEIQQRQVQESVARMECVSRDLGPLVGMAGTLVEQGPSRATIAAAVFPGILDEVFSFSRKDGDERGKVSDAAALAVFAADALIAELDRK